MRRMRGMRLGTRVRREIHEFRRQRPPSCPRGWSTGPPDFVGVGSVKCGTTWWYHLVSQHPEIRASGVKELHFFSTPAPRPSEAEAYTRWFPRPPGALAGEWTPDYLYRSHSLPRLHAAAPEVRLLALIRDPIEHYRSECAVFSDVPDWSPEMAIDRGRYGNQLSRLHELFDPGQVLVLQYEAATCDPRHELAKTFAFLGVDTGFVPDDLERPRNVTKRPKPDLSVAEREEIAGRCRDDVDLLCSLRPELDRTLWSV